MAIIYEQPLNELIRVSLRLEYLFKQIDACLADHSNHAKTQFTVRLIIDVLNVLNRPDLKAKLTKEFNRFIANFSKLESAANISKETLTETLEQLKALMTYFLNTSGKIGQNLLRDTEFLANLRQNFMSPGGDSPIDAPAYYYWLNQPEDQHQTQIKTWLDSFNEIRQATELLLNIVRHSSEPKTMAAEKGFYHESLDSRQPQQLIRVALPETAILYPEISAGRQRMTIRFVIPDINARPHQTPEDIDFDLTLCII